MVMGGEWRPENVPVCPGARAAHVDLGYRDVPSCPRRLKVVSAFPTRRAVPISANGSAYVVREAGVP